MKSKKMQASVQPGPQYLALQPAQAPKTGGLPAANPNYPTGAQRFLSIRPQNGRQGLVVSVGNVAFIAPNRKAGPSILVKWPSTSQNIPHTSVLSANEIDKSSLAFVARTMHANLPSNLNHNAQGQLNA
jgi:hypothetical protein